MATHQLRKQVMTILSFISQHRPSGPRGRPFPNGTCHSEQECLYKWRWEAFLHAEIPKSPFSLRLGRKPSALYRTYDTDFLPSSYTTKTTCPCPISDLRFVAACTPGGFRKDCTAPGSRHNLLNTNGLQGSRSDVAEYGFRKFLKARLSRVAVIPYALNHFWKNVRRPLETVYR